jgi:phosphate transport system substrate-binding protein
MWASVAFAGVVLAATAGLALGQDALELQRQREKFVKERGNKVFYPADKFNLKNIPAFKPEQKVSGTIRIWGNNYLKDGNLAQYWEEGFHKFYPDVKIEWTLPSAANAVGALYSGAADIGATGRGIEWPERLAFQRRFNYDVTEITVTTGSYNVAGWSNALGIFVNKDNPITKITFSQLDGIFGAEREGGWGSDFAWHLEYARGPEKNIRTWGQLGLTGEWADKPINVYGLNLRYEQSLRICDPILKGSDKWNEKIKLFANYSKADGNLTTAAQQVMERLSNDRYGIGYGGLMNLTPQTKPLALAVEDGGPYIELTLDSAQNRSYPLIGNSYFYLNRKPGTPLDAKLKEFIRYVLSREGQEAVARDGKYLPLTAEAAAEQLRELQ